MYSTISLILLGCVVAGTFGAPADVPPEKLQPTVIPIVSQSDELEPNGTYKFSYETGNGITREETAYEKLLPKGREASSSEGGEDDDNDSNEIHVQRGSYSYTAPDGTVISVRYIADENGFQPIGDHIPRSPVSVPGLNSAEKSGRALNIPDSSESASVPEEAKAVVKSTKSAAEETKPDDKSTASAEANPLNLPNNVEPETASITTINEAKTDAVPVTPKEKQGEAISVSTTEQSEAPAPITSSQEVPSPPAPVQEAKPQEELSTIAEGLLPSTQSAVAINEAEPAVTEPSATEIGDKSTADVDVSTEAASPAPAPSTQSSADTEKASTASAEQASTASEQNASSEVSEQSSSTSAPEPTSSAEVVGQSASTEAVNQSITEEIGQSSTNAPETASPEESSLTTVAA